ncbi:hypothetical protein [Hymenobacter convexus]|uniref:hypothetical protein n=1 Tax=Hymenobacter sp. CA1UV-4 TaxID=3063782 RepID=UPI002712CAD3|nr:hypothetical protein [Hymenobacter sp. CA1UV-4]MDO7854322.1 hypothetical protein [Hymenobacter sp. CA1UV-4]
MKHVITVFAFFGAISGLGSCSVPDRPGSARLAGHRPSLPESVPCDSTTSYFSSSAEATRLEAADTTRTLAAINRADCAQSREYASRNLCAFNAPILSSGFIGHAIYRLLYLRSFHRPALLTLDCAPQGGTLTTQFLNKPADWTASAAEMAARTRAATRKVQEIERRLQTGNAWPADSERLENAKFQFVHLALVKSPISITTEQAVHLSLAEVQQFKELLAKASFWQLPSCEPTRYFDGADYILETHEAKRYHMVKQQSPASGTGFQQACAFLLNKSSFDFNADQRF